MVTNAGQQGQRMGLCTLPTSNPTGTTSNAHPSPSSGATRVRLGNWSHSEIIALITCKHKEYVAQKLLVDPRARMVTSAQKWETIRIELQALTHSKTPRGAKMYKDKWNSLNTNYKKVTDYRKGIGNHTSFWDLSNEEKDGLGLPRQFNSDFFEAIEAFQGERTINTPTHVRDSQGADDSVYCDSNHRSPPSNTQGESQGTVPFCVNLDSESQPPLSSNHVIQLSDTPTPTPVPVGLATRAATAPNNAPGNTLVKRIPLSAFMPIINAANKSSKVLVAAMDRINVTQQELEKSRTRSQTKTSKQHLEYLKARDKKAHKMSKNMVQVLSNLSTAMCHAFIKDPTSIPLLVTFDPQSSEDGPRPSIHVLESDEE